jgi:cell division transport system permease protein
MRAFDFFQKNAEGPGKNKTELSLIFVFVVFLLSFVISCTFLFTKGFHDWGSSRESKITIEIPISIAPPGTPPEQFALMHTQKVEAIIDKVKRMPGCLGVRTVDPEKIRSMMEAWTGERGGNAEMQFPTLLDAMFQPSESINVDNMVQQLRLISADITVEHHNTWSKKLAILGRSLEIVSMIIGCFVLLCLVVIVALITKSSLQAYYSTLDILRLMGAKDSYIANIYQVYVLKTSLKGGGVGFCFALPTVYLLIIALQHLGLSGIAWNSIFLYIFVVLIFIPIAVVLISVLVSRLIVLSQLRRLDAYS